MRILNITCQSDSIYMYNGIHPVVSVLLPNLFAFVVKDIGGPICSCAEWSMYILDTSSLLCCFATCNVL